MSVPSTGANDDVLGEQVLAVVREMVASSFGAGARRGVALGSRLDRDLGFDSLAPARAAAPESSGASA